MRKKLSLSRTTIQILTPTRLRTIDGGALTGGSGTRQTMCTRMISGCHDSASYDPVCQPTQTTNNSQGC